MEATATDLRALLSELEGRLRPRLVRERVIASLEELFAAGTAPNPPLEGFHSGRAITSTITGVVDSFGRIVADLYMPWLGKTFDPGAHEGFNVLVASARLPMKAMWPRYEPETANEDIAAFRFKTAVGPGALEPNLDVLKIDYDFEANPPFIIRRILDELVQIDDGLYLGKVLYRRASGFQRIGFFTL